MEGDCYLQSSEQPAELIPRPVSFRFVSVLYSQLTPLSSKGYFSCWFFFQYHVLYISGHSYACPILRQYQFPCFIPTGILFNVSYRLFSSLHNFSQQTVIPSVLYPNTTLSSHNPIVWATVYSMHIYIVCWLMNIKLNSVLHVQDVKLWNGLNWLMLRTGGRILWTRLEVFGFHEGAGSRLFQVHYSVRLVS